MLIKFYVKTTKLRSKIQMLFVSNEFESTSSIKDDFYEVFHSTSQQQTAPIDVEIAEKRIEDEARENIVEIEGDISQLYGGLEHSESPEREGGRFEEGTTNLVVQNSTEAIGN